MAVEHLVDGLVRGGKVYSSVVRLTPMRAIRMKCLDCSGGNEREVRECIIPGCALYPYRMGKGPKDT